MIDCEACLKPITGIKNRFLAINNKKGPKKPIAMCSIRCIEMEPKHIRRMIQSGYIEGWLWCG